MNVQKYTGSISAVSRRNTGCKRMKLKIKIKAKYFFFQKEYIPCAVPATKARKATKRIPLLAGLRPVFQN